MQSHQNTAAQPGRFVILYDRVFSQVTGAVGATLFEDVPLGALMDVHLLFSGTAAANTSGPTLFMLRVSTEATNTPTTAYEARLWYVDN